MTAAVERRHRLMKVKKGDYLLPSNDATTLWRIRSYTDGPSFGLDPEIFPRDFERWSLSRWHRRMGDPAEMNVNLEDSDLWIGEEDGFESRRDAIEAALKREVEA